jgi:hypothetical protein
MGRSLVGCRIDSFLVCVSPDLEVAVFRHTC